jgi:small subunit ribosomal protein S12
MSSLNYLLRNPRKPKIKKSRTPILGVWFNSLKSKYSQMNCPQIAGPCKKVEIVKPKKPNSAARKVTRVTLEKRGRKKSLLVYVPGESNPLQENTRVLIRGGRRPDLPGINYQIVLGALGAKGIEKRMQGRSLYGTRRPKKVKENN